MSEPHRQYILGGAIFLGALFLASGPWQPYLGDFAVKGGGILLLALYAYTSAHQYRQDLALALVFSAGGDVFLAFNAFVPGLLSFLVAHLVYVATFITISRSERLYLRNRWPIVAMLLVLTAAYLVWLWPNLGDLAIPVTIYMVVLVGMGTSALLTPFHSPFVAIGAMSFILSDSLIALNKFAMPFDLADPLIWITYFAAQLLIVLGFFKGWPHLVRQN